MSCLERKCDEWYTFLSRLEPGDIILCAGLLDLNNPPSYSQLRHVKQFAVPESYAFPTNDIALLKLDAPFDFAESKGHIGAVCLPAKDRPLEGEVEVAGWGATAPDEPSSPHLLAVSIPVTSPPCFGIFDKKVMFCAGSPGKDSCPGDSGGPVMKEDSGSSILVGVVSGGGPCGVEPGFNTRVPAFTEWISENIVKLRQ
ncbi:trypsin-1-like [Ixodes scapularis]|uniref:trypsin-1-like n=1 Tax=Ixodes scapularis TaxID=6945 RepID=UPI001A9DB9F0|nr:trypsin-1-like [Ixodes scapularis]